jgi:flagellar basal-body rod protein FlgF
VNVSLYQAAAALDANSRWQESIAENLASSSVPGYKKQQLTQAAVHAGLLSASGAAGAAQYFSVPQSTLSTNFAQGELKFTGNVSTSAIDVAVEGKGFFEAKLPDGATALTRDGEFQVNSQGQLVTKESFPVLGVTGPIQLSANHSGPLAISSTGLVTQGAETIGQLKMADVAKPQLLTKISGAYFVAQNPKAGLTPSKSTLREGYLEGSNSSTLNEMASMMTSSRGFEANQKVIQIQDDRMNHTISELGNPTS